LTLSEVVRHTFVVKKVSSSVFSVFSYSLLLISNVCHIFDCGNIFWSCNKKRKSNTQAISSITTDPNKDKTSALTILPQATSTFLYDQKMSQKCQMHQQPPTPLPTRQAQNFSASSSVSFDSQTTVGTKISTQFFSQAISLPTLTEEININEFHAILRIWQPCKPIYSPHCLQLTP